MARTSISFKLPDEIVVDIRRASIESGRSQSDLLIEAWQKFRNLEPAESSPATIADLNSVRAELADLRAELGKFAA